MDTRGEVPCLKRSPRSTIQKDKPDAAAIRSPPRSIQTAMGGRPRVCHLECGGHQTVMVNGEETAGHLTGDCADVAGRRDRRSLLCAVVFGRALRQTHYLCHNHSPSCVSARRSSNANRLCGQNSAGSEYLPRRRAAEERAAETGWGPRR